MVRYTTGKELYRHASDDELHDCGRACAQMIISALTHGVPAGVLPTPAQRAQPVPIRQDQLRWSEANNTDVAGNWFTFPDEMLLLLKNDQNLVSLGLTDWRLANCSTPKKLFAWAAKSIRAGKPAVLNIKPSDHWVCLRSVEYEAGALSLLEYLDPLLKHETNPPGPQQHTYRDLCETDANWARIRQTPGELGNWQIPIGPTPPTTYQGRCIGIVYGPPPTTPKELAASRILGRRYQIKKPGPPTPEERVRELLTELAVSAGIPTLTAILHGTSEIRVRVVRDMTGLEKPYAIAAMFADPIERGVVAIFDAEVTEFFQLRLTSNRRLTDSIRSTVSAEPLWWRRSGLATLYAPYFPFEQIVEPGPVPSPLKFRRLIDSLVLVP